MAEAKSHLCELDGVIGDADHGIAMDLGFSTVATNLGAPDAAASDPASVFNTAAKSFLNAVGASSGPLYATAFMRAGASVKGKAELSDADFAEAFIAMAQGHPGSRQGGTWRQDDDRRVDACGKGSGKRQGSRQHHWQTCWMKPEKRPRPERNRRRR